MFSEEAANELPNVVFHLFGKIPVYNFVITMWGIMLLLLVLSWLGTRNMKRVPSGMQNILEYGIESLLNFFSDSMGKERAKAYIPLLATFFLFILFSNYSGMLPGMNIIPGMKVPTSEVSVTAALAIITFFSVFILGIKKKGIRFFKHFMQPVAFMLVLNILDELIRPLSLTLRLYGNIYGEEEIIKVLGNMAGFLPIPMMFLGLLTGGIQAFVFTLLSSTYIAGATEDH